MRLIQHRNLWYSPEELKSKRARKRNDKKKMLYGTTTSLKRKWAKKLIARDGSRCRHCGRHLDVWSRIFTVDHIKPASKGGKTELENLQILCLKCNGKKGNQDEEYARENTAPRGYKLMAEAFERAGITPESIAALSQQPAQPSETSDQKTSAPPASGQSRS